jgi:hypothetical protein
MSIKKKSTCREFIIIIYQSELVIAKEDGRPAPVKQQLTAIEAES